MSQLPKSLHILRQIESDGNLVLAHFYGSGSFQDFSGNSHNSTPTAGLYFNRDGVLFTSTGYKLDDGADFIGIGDITVCIYCNPRSIGQIAGRFIENGKFIFGLTAGKIFCSSDGSTSPVSAAINYNINSLFSVTRASDGIATMYVNGAISGTPDQSTGTPVAGSTNVIIGNESAGSRTFDGLMSDVIVVNGILSQSEIAQMHGEIRSLKWPTKTKSKASIFLPTDADDSSLVFSSDMELVNGKIVDASDNANGATKGGTNLFQTNTILSKALSFNEAEWLDLDTNIEMTSGDYTVAAWVRPRDVAAKGGIVGNYWFMYDTNNKLTHYTGSNYRNSNNSLVWGKMHHVVQTIASDGSLRYYIDGELDTSVHGDADTSIVATALGNHAAVAPSHAADMDLVDIKIYSEVKSAEWVKNQYTKGAKAVQFQTSYGIEESVANVTSGSIGDSDIYVSTGEWQIVNDSIGGLTTGVDLNYDGDMEDVGVDNYTVDNSATLTKEPGTRDGGLGTQVLRIAYNGSSSPGAFLEGDGGSHFLTVGKTYKITGWARGDGTFYPRLIGPSGNYLWDGTASTDWQYFESIDLAARDYMRFRSDCTSAGYVEFDDVSVQEVVSNTKVLECKSAGIAYIPIDNFMSATDAAYGAWEFWLYKTSGGNPYVMLNSDTIGEYDAAGSNSYVFYASGSEQYVFGKTIGGVYSHITYSSGAGDTLLDANAWNKITISRNSAGVFTLYHNNTYAKLGANPSTQTQLISGNYLVLDFDVGDKISLGDRNGDYAFKKYLGTVQSAGYLILENDQSTLTQTTIYITATNGKSLTIGWGDNSFNKVTCNDVEQTLTHNYASEGAYKIKLYGDVDAITSFKCYSQAFISGDIGRFSKMTSLTYLYLNSTSVSGDISAVSGLTSLTRLYLYSTSVSGDISAVSGLTSLTRLYLYSTSVSGDISAVALPAWAGINLQIQDLGLDATEVDNFLIDFEDGAGAAGTLTLNGTNATRTSASDAAVASLRGAGWTVNVNE